MYQLPLGHLEKIRKARKAVKNVLSEIGLEDCKNLLKDLDEKDKSEGEDDDDEAFQETEWSDFTYGYGTRLRKKWPYRSRALCCSMCKYSSQNINNFRNHITRHHGQLQGFCSLVPCPHCLFVGHPKLVKKHMLLFHSSKIQQQRETTTATAATTTTTAAAAAAAAAAHGLERYRCCRCGLPNSSIFAMKKHIILKHLNNLAEQYIGYRLTHQGTSPAKIYCCKVCKVNTGNLDQMLHHLLVDPAHYAVSTRVQGMIRENKNYTIKPTPNGNGLFMTFPSIAPKPQQAQIINSKSLVIPNNGQGAGTVLALQQLQGTPGNGATLICAPGTNQAFLPPQASALVQLASAEAKGLLQPGATIALRSALSQGASIVQLPTGSNVALKQGSLTLTSQQQSPQSQHILVPSGVQAKVAAGAIPKAGGVTQKGSPSQASLQGTMLTSQSLLSHLIPTGNKMNGMPTYTFAPMQTAVPASQSTNTPLKAVAQTSNSLPQTKKWITCPLCNELFPSNVFDLHIQAAHQTKSSTAMYESVAARASFLKKMPDKTVKCLACRTLLAEKSIFQHLLHGLSCLYCSTMFFSIKQLVDHVKQHNPTSKAYSDFLRQKFRIYSKGTGGILFPYFDVHTTAPKEVLGDSEVHIALVTSSLDLIYFKLQPNVQPEQPVCPAPGKVISAFCPFCDEKFPNDSKHLQHLKQKHFVAPTIHAILRTEAFKCIYCNGVYTGKVTQQAVMLHIQRCRCSPKPSQQPAKPAAPTPVPLPSQQAVKTAQQVIQQSGLYFLQVPQGLTVKPAVTPTRPIQPAPTTPEAQAELESKKRLEEALKKVIEDNKREREHRAAMRKKRELENKEKLLPPPEPEDVFDPNVKLALEPTAADRCDAEERKNFIGKYFNLNPYASRVESEELCKRLYVTKQELAAHFSNKRSKCMKSLKRNTAAIFLGFNMNEVSKLKHDLLIPEQQPVDPVPPAEPQPVEPAAPMELQPVSDAAQGEKDKEDPEPMDQSGKEKVSEDVAMAEAEQME